MEIDLPEVIAEVKPSSNGTNKLKGERYGGVAQHFIVALGHAPVHSAQRNRRRSSKGR